MSASLLLTALLMGLVGGPHCVAMCGAACAGIGRAAQPKSGQAILAFQVGRMAGYGAMGGLAAASMQGLGWLSVHSAAVRPAWTLLHLVAVAMGLVLLIQARQPQWVESAARSIWGRVRGHGGRLSRSGPLALGAAWSLMPCGLLYSALLVAALAGSVLAGVAVMVVFALGTAVSLTLGPWLWLRWTASGAARLGHREWGLRLAGLVLALTAGWGLWMGLVHDTAPWCVTPTL